MSGVVERVVKTAVEYGAAEIRIRIGKEATFGELKEKLELLATAFSPEEITVVPGDAA